MICSSAPAVSAANRRDASVPCDKLAALPFSGKDAAESQRSPFLDERFEAWGDSRDDHLFSTGTEHPDSASSSTPLSVPNPNCARQDGQREGPPSSGSASSGSVFSDSAATCQTSPASPRSAGPSPRQAVLSGDGSKRRCRTLSSPLDDRLHLLGDRQLGSGNHGDSLSAIRGPSRSFRHRRELTVAEACLKSNEKKQHAGCLALQELRRLSSDSEESCFSRTSSACSLQPCYEHKQRGSCAALEVMTSMSESELEEFLQVSTESLGLMTLNCAPEK